MPSGVSSLCFAIWPHSFSVLCRDFDLRRGTVAAAAGIEVVERASDMTVEHFVSEYKVEDYMVEEDVLPGDDFPEEILDEECAEAVLEFRLPVMSTGNSRALFAAHPDSAKCQLR
eukprot:5252901-Amphidinium_carterae.1